MRIFIVKSEERAGYETAQRLKAMDRVRTQLERLTRRVAQGTLKAADKIGAAAARTLGRYHGYRSLRLGVEGWALPFLRAPGELEARASL